MTTATYTLTQAATLLGIGKSSAYAAAQTGTFPTPIIRIGGRYVVPKAPLDELLGITPDPQEVA
ncbi:helix-turn-helix transcriptional regulator [Corynebacterium variabile]|uniref:helix-turn-helix transcriptional regulator n=1 Tax=Corynebacterium variabile TaxID=1727 RepID=UPI003CB55051